MRRHHPATAVSGLVAAVVLAFPAAGAAAHGATGGEGTASGTSAQASVAEAGGAAGGVPFTGLDVALILGGGAGLIAAGAGMRRVSDARA